MGQGTGGPLQATASTFTTTPRMVGMPWCYRAPWSARARTRPPCWRPRQWRGRGLDGQHLAQDGGQAAVLHSPVDCQGADTATLSNHISIKIWIATNVPYQDPHRIQRKLFTTLKKSPKKLRRLWSGEKERQHIHILMNKLHQSQGAQQGFL